MEPQTKPDVFDGGAPLLYNTSPEAFEEAWRDAESHEEQADVREALKRMDGGRWYDVLDNAHLHLAHTDSNSRAATEAVHGDDFLAWVGIFGLVEDLNTFSDVTGIER